MKPYRYNKTVPKTLGACADKLYKLRAERYRLKKEVEKVEAVERAIREYLIKKLPKSEAKGIVGQSAKAVIKTEDIPTVKDWRAFYKHVLKTKDFSLMQRRVSSQAVKEHWEEGEKIPGVKKFTAVKVSVTKR